MPRASKKRKAFPTLTSVGGATRAVRLGGARLTEWLRKRLATAAGLAVRLQPDESADLLVEFDDGAVYQERYPTLVRALDQIAHWHMMGRLAPDAWVDVHGALVDLRGEFWQVRAEAYLIERLGEWFDDPPQLVEFRENADGSVEYRAWWQDGRTEYGGALGVAIEALKRWWRVVWRREFRPEAYFFAFDEDVEVVVRRAGAGWRVVGVQSRPR